MPLIRRASSGPRALWWFALALASTLFLLHSGFETTEGSDHARTAIHWIETGTLGQARQPAAIFVRGTDGRYYPVHELGAVLWQLPSAAIALAAEGASGLARFPGTSQRVSEVIVALGSIAPVTLTAVGFWKWLEWRFAAPLAVRVPASTLLVFATMLLPYSRMLSDVGPTGMWLTWAAALGARAASSGAAWAAVGSGFALGFALMTRIPAVVAIVPLFFVMVANTPPSRRWRQAALAIAGALPCVAAVLWYNDLRTGSPFMPGFLMPQFLDVRPGNGSLAEGIAGLLASPGKSIFVFSPALVLGIAGWRRLFRAAPMDALGVAIACLFFLLAHGSLGSWHADWGWGPRHFVFMLPILWLPAAILIGSLSRGSAGWRAAAALLAISVAVQAAALTVNWHYQYRVMWADGRLDARTPWRADNQMTDTLRAAVRNAARTIGAGEPSRAPLPGGSQVLYVASTGINIWWITALRAGVRPLAVWPIVIGVAGVAAFSWRRLRRAAA